MACCKKNDFPRTVPIQKIIVETPQVKTYVLPISLGALPGQFVNVWVPGVNERPISVAFDDGKTLRLAIAAVGETTKKLAKMKVGEYIGVRGPYGTHFTWKPKNRIAMIAGGYGSAPLYFAAHLAVKQGCTVDFFIGARNKKLLLYPQLIKKLRGIKLHIATDDGSEGFKGYNAHLFEKALKEGMRYHTVMTCGPEMMMKKVSDLCAAHKIDAQIDIERYMKCGLGICGNCCVDDLGVPTCVKGTIISNETARSLKEFGVYHRDDVGRKHYY